MKNTFQKIKSSILCKDFLYKLSSSMLTGIIFAISMNLFWGPGHIYTGGFNGIAQLFYKATMHNLNFPISFWIVLVNIPIFLFSLFHFSKKFIFFTLLTIFFTSFFTYFIHFDFILTKDQLIDSIFGGILGGLSSGISLRSGIASGGLDILSIYFKQKYKINFLPISVTTNLIIMIFAGLLNNWQTAFYSLIGLFIGAWVTSLLYTRQQLMQVMIVTNNPKKMSHNIQDHLHRGVTVLDSYGAYKNKKNKVIFLVITLEELSTLNKLILESDPNSFSSSWKIEKTLGRFYESEL